MPELHPALVLLVGAAVLAFVPRRLQPVGFVVVALAGVAAVAGLTDGTTTTYEYYGYELTPLRVDGLSLAFAYVFAAAVVAGGIFGYTTMGPLERTAALSYAAAGLGVVLAGDVITLFIFWELKVVTSVMLIFARRNAASAAAGLRYLYVHLAGGVTLLAGLLWNIVDTGSIAFDGFDFSHGGVLILVGFALSAAIPPLHAWLPDAYPAATIAGTVFLSAFTTKSAVYALARGFPGLELLIWLGVAMALYGAVFALMENDTRRLLSYHIVSQVGFMVAAVGIGTELAINGAVAHAFAHILYKALLLMGAGALLYATGRSKLNELGGLARSLPWVLVLYMVGALSISAVPLFSGFGSKEMSMYAASTDATALVYWLLKLASIGTFLSIALKLPWFAWFGERTTQVRRAVPGTMYGAMGLLAAANIGLGLFPIVLYNVLPFDITFEPFEADKIVETLVMLGFAAVAFWLLRARLKPKPVVTLDTDWVYRELPVRVGRWWASEPSVRRGLAHAAGVPAQTRGAAARRVSAAGTSVRAYAGMAAMWLTGSAIVAASVLLLVVSL